MNIVICVFGGMGSSFVPTSAVSTPNFGSTAPPPVVPRPNQQGPMMIGPVIGV